jgi:hypothetical protein
MSKWRQKPKWKDDSITFERVGYYAIGCRGHCHTIEEHYNYNGSGDDAFGGAKKWPVVTCHVAFSTGDEKRRDDFGVKLREFIDSYFAEEVRVPRGEN